MGGVLFNQSDNFLDGLYYYYYYYYYYLLQLSFHSVAVVLTLVTNTNKYT